jgi:hypothetical protein
MRKIARSFAHSNGQNSTTFFSASQHLFFPKNLLPTMILGFAPMLELPFSAMSLLCFRYVPAMCLLCFCYVFAMSLLCITFLVPTQTTLSDPSSGKADPTWAANPTLQGSSTALAPIRHSRSFS